MEGSKRRSKRPIKRKKFHDEDETLRNALRSSLEDTPIVAASDYNPDDEGEIAEYQEYVPGDEYEEPVAQMPMKKKRKRSENIRTNSTIVTASAASRAPGMLQPASAATVVTAPVQKIVKKRREPSDKGWSVPKSVEITLKGMSQWKASDDILLINNCEQLRNLEMIHKTVRNFSCSFTLEEITARWIALLYDERISSVSKQAIASMPQETRRYYESLTYFSDEEELHLGTIHSESKPTLEAFQQLLDENHSDFHNSRNAEKLHGHWKLLRGMYMLADQAETLMSMSFSDEEEEEVVVEQVCQFTPNNIYAEKPEQIKEQLEINRQFDKARLPTLERQCKQLDYIINEVVRSTSPTVDDKPTEIAVLKGRKVVYSMCTNKITFGRGSLRGPPVDIDLSLEGYSNCISRKQGEIKREDSGEFVILNEGARTIFVDGHPLHKGCETKLNDSSVIVIQTLNFVFSVKEQT